MAGSPLRKLASRCLSTQFGIFLGHTFIVNDRGHEVVDEFPLEIAVAG